MQVFTPSLAPGCELDIVSKFQHNQVVELLFWAVSWAQQLQDKVNYWGMLPPSL